MRGWVILVSGILFCATTSFLGDTSRLMGAVTQSWVPYVAVPFAMGFAACRTTVVRAGLLGALSSVLIVVAFYGVSPFDAGGYPVDTTSLFVDYAPIGIVTGFSLAASSRAVARRAGQKPAWWSLVCCSALTAAVIASWWLLGWGRHEVVASSGVVSVGASTADVVASTAIVLFFSCALIVYAIRGLPGVLWQGPPVSTA